MNSSALYFLLEPAFAHFKKQLRNDLETGRTGPFAFAAHLYKTREDASNPDPGAALTDRIMDAVSDFEAGTNGIRIKPGPEQLDFPFGTPEADNLLRHLDELETSFEIAFWAVPAHQNDYRRIATFEAFQSLRIREDEYVKYLQRGQLFHVEGLLEFTVGVLAQLYPEFHFRRGRNKLLAHRELDNGYSLELSLDLKKWSAQLRRGSMEMPELLLRVLKRRGSKHAAVAAIPFRNPALPVSASEPARFLAFLSLVQTGPSEWTSVNQMRFSRLPEGGYEISNTAEFGDRLKRHLYYFMAANRHLNRSLEAWLDEASRLSAAH